MERIHTLIDKLLQQKQQNASAAHLLFTVQLLHAELLRSTQKNSSLGTPKVAVTLPANVAFVEEAIKSALADVKEDVEKPKIESAAREQLFTPIPEAKEPVKQEAKLEKQEPVTSFTQQQIINPAFISDAEAPTLSQYTAKKEEKKEIYELKPPRELHEMLSAEKESLNDRLKEEKTELAHVLTGAPIKDLRKAIGINDRFTLIRELFRGDEAMYERSIKTINGFGIYSEAEYWISRELKYKLGWNETNPSVQHFYQLVRRRFS